MDESSESRQSREQRLFVDELTQTRLAELEQIVAREQHQRQLAESLREIGVVLSSSLDQTEVLDKILAQLAVIIRHDGGAIFLHEGESLVLLHGIGPAAKAHEGDRIPLISQNPTVRVFFNEEPLIINSSANEPYWLEWSEGDTRYAWVGVPLIVEGEVVGVLTLDRYEPDSYTEEDAQTLQIFAEQAALAIRNARLYEALRESEGRFRTVWDTSADALALSDAKGIVLAANPAYLELYGYTANEVIGQPFNIIFPETERDWAMEQYKVVFTSPTIPPTFNSVVHQADGTERIVETTIGFITQDGERTAMLSNIRDVTEQRHLEEQLRQSQKMEAVGQLAGGMAHHYNNMLTAIMGYVGLSLTKLPPDHPIAKDLERIQNTTQRAATLTRQLLTFTSRQPARLKVVNLNDLIRNTEHLLRSLLSSAVEMQVVLAPDLASVQMDGAQFEQVLFNLIGNARDAMPLQRGKLLIQTANLTLEEAGEIPAGDYVQVMVRDNGHGIPEQIKDRIFDPFFTTKEVGQGTGLGLSTCYGIITQHHGYITVESKSGQGTTFYIYLPRHKAKPTPTPTDHKVELAQGQETVLLVEDNDDVRDLVRQVLQRQGYTLLEAENGQAALSLLDEQPLVNLDLLLIDVVMPGMGGVALVKKLRTRYRQLKVLMISGYNDDILSQQDILDLEIAFLAKPFSPAKLIQTVRDVLDTLPQ